MFENWKRKTHVLVNTMLRWLRVLGWLQQHAKWESKGIHGKHFTYKCDVCCSCTLGMCKATYITFQGLTICGHLLCVHQEIPHSITWFAWKEKWRLWNWYAHDLSWWKGWKQWENDALKVLLENNAWENKGMPWQQGFEVTIWGNHSTNISFLYITMVIEIYCAQISCLVPRWAIYDVS
jgi:hypothetical protein